MKKLFKQTGFFLLVWLILPFMISCTNPEPPPIETQPTPVAERIKLYWEDTTSPRPERIPWSDTLTALVRENLPTFSKAKDIKEICPKFDKLSEDLKVKGISEFFVALAFYESGYNPATSSVDVGTVANKCSHSIGLFQVSCTDAAAKAVGATTVESLKDPLMNIKTAVEVFRRQVNKCGEFILPNASSCRYFATLLEGNKYQKIQAIKDRTLKYAPACK